MSLSDSVQTSVAVLQEQGNLTSNASSFLNSTANEESPFSQVFGIDTIAIPYMVFMWTIMLGFVVVVIITVLPRAFGWAIAKLVNLGLPNHGKLI